MNEEPQTQPTIEPIQTPTPTPELTHTTNTPTNTQPTHSGLAIAALVVGIVSILMGLVPFAGFVLGAVAITLGIISLKKKISKGMSIAGIVTGGVAVLCNAIMTFLFFIGLASLMFAGSVTSKIADNINQASSDYNSSEQAKIDAQKDFSKGTTATFGDFEVKINSIQRNYVPEDEYSQASEGKELVVVNVSVKNTSDETASF
jgi:hypothetical protein